jgi:hypothetical protein
MAVLDVEDRLRAGGSDLGNRHRHAATSGTKGP